MARGKVKIVKGVLSGLATLIFTLLAIIGITAIILHLLGFGFYAVRTDSMGNIYPSGTLILVDNTSPSDIVKGDVISVVIEDDVVLTHRAVRNDTENELIYTQGDMNDSEDSFPSTYDNVLGRVVLGIPKIGNIALKLDGTNGRRALIVIVCVLLAYVLISLVVNIVDRITSRRKGDERKDKKHL